MVSDHNRIKLESVYRKSPEKSPTFLETKQHASK
jgi:hypothetical protein